MNGDCVVFNSLLKPLETGPLKMWANSLSGLKIFFAEIKMLT
jgi:hypothetical protein